MSKVIYNCYLHYADGLTKKLSISQKELDETFDVWKNEIDSKGENELRYLKIRKTKLKNGSTS